MTDEKPMPRRLLTRADIDKIADFGDIETREIPTDEWGEGTAVLVRGLTGAERDQIELSMNAIRTRQLAGKIEIRARLAAFAICDPTTMKRMYSDADVPLLAKRSAIVLDRIFDAVRDMSGMTTSASAAIRAELKNGLSVNSGSD